MRIDSKSYYGGGRKIGDLKAAVIYENRIVKNYTIASITHRYVVLLLYLTPHLIAILLSNMRLLESVGCLYLVRIFAIEIQMRF